MFGYFWVTWSATFCQAFRSSVPDAHIPQVSVTAPLLALLPPADSWPPPPQPAVSPPAMTTAVATASDLRPLYICLPIAAPLNKLGAELIDPKLGRSNP